MKNPKVSVIIPVYNGEKTLKLCLNSILNQTYDNYEVILVDNNSTDKTKEIIKEFQKKDKDIKYIFENQIGRGAARNTGEKEASGDIILMTDCDCIIPFDWINKMIEPIINNESEAVQGSQNFIPNSFWNKYMKEDNDKKIYNSKKEDIIIGKIDTSNFAISKEALKKIGFTKRKYVSGNDAALSIEFYRNGLRLRVLDTVFIDHFQINSFNKIIYKYFNRAKWTGIITKDHKTYLKNNNFLKETNQTLFSFIKLVPGLIKTLVNEGFGKMYFDLVTGISWRIGLVRSKIKK